MDVVGAVTFTRRSFARRAINATEGGNTTLAGSVMARGVAGPVFIDPLAPGKIGARTP